jgi:hypothetical protein
LIGKLEQLPVRQPENLSGHSRPTQDRRDFLSPRYFPEASSSGFDSALLPALCQVDIEARRISAVEMLLSFPSFTALFVLRHLLAVSLLAGAVLGCGDRVTARMRGMDGAERWLASIVIGLGMLAMLYFALGALGLLYSAIAWLVLVPLFALSVRGGAGGTLAQIANRLRYEIFTLSGGLIFASAVR